MKQALHCGLSSKPTLNHTGELNAAIWCSRMWVSSCFERARVLVGGEVAALATPVRRSFRRRGRSSPSPSARASGEPIWPRKYFWATMLVAFCDQLAGNSTSRCSKATWSPWPMRASRSSHSTVVERMHAGSGEVALDRQRLAGCCRLGDGGVGNGVHRHFLLCCDGVADACSTRSIWGGSSILSEPPDGTNASCRAPLFY